MWERHCKTCGAVGCNSMLCSKPRPDITDERAIEVLKVTGQAIPDSSDQIQEAAKGMLLLSTAGDTQLKAEEDRKEAEAVDMETEQIYAYDKVCEFVNWCCEKKLSIPQDQLQDLGPPRRAKLLSSTDNARDQPSAPASPFLCPQGSCVCGRVA